MVAGVRVAGPLTYKHGGVVGLSYICICLYVNAPLYVHYSSLRPYCHTCLVPFISVVVHLDLSSLS